MATPAGGHYEGMPQLDPAFMPNLIFWLVLTMLAIYWILSRIALAANLAGSSMIVGRRLRMTWMPRRS